ncbi:MAG: hypothetical protein GY861_03070 [bacterium]|nr:hypothetical protein [bacterium]
MKPIRKLTDMQLVAHIAGTYEISEFEVFRRASEHWHKGDIYKQDFIRYLFEETIPYYVRHYCTTQQAKLEKDNSFQKYNR